MTEVINEVTAEAPASQKVKVYKDFMGDMNYAVNGVIFPSPDKTPALEGAVCVLLFPQMFMRMPEVMMDWAFPEGLEDSLVHEFEITEDAARLVLAVMRAEKGVKV